MLHQLRDVELNLEGRLVVLVLTFYRACARLLLTSNAPVERDELVLPTCYIYIYMYMHIYIYIYMCVCIHII